MTAPEHDKALLGAYVLGTLSPEETQAIEQHVASCPECRQELADLAVLKDMMGEVPPEAFLDGPPEGGDLLLQRTLRQVRAEKSTVTRRRGFLVAAALVLVAALGLGGGVLLGQGTSAQPPSASPATTTLPVNAKQGVATNASSGAHMTATVIPAAGWVRIQVQVSAGIAAGERCKLLVVSKSGESTQFGGWQVSPTLAQKGVTLDGTALIAPDDISSVQVVTDTGQTLLSAPIPA